MRNRVEAIIPDGSGGFWAERLLSPEYPQSLGKIRCLGGKIEAGETPVAALVRELQEEYDIQVALHQVQVVRIVEGPRGEIIRCRVNDLHIAGSRQSTEGIEELVLVPVLPAPWY